MSLRVSLTKKKVGGGIVQVLVSLIECQYMKEKSLYSGVSPIPGLRNDSLQDACI